MGQITGINGIETVVGVSPVTILIAPELAVAVPVIVGNAGLVADGNGKKILYAGAPLFGNLLVRTAAFVKSTITNAADVKAVYKLKIATKAVAVDAFTLDGVTYTAAAAADAPNKVFAVGANADAQVTSLLTMLTHPNFVVTGATDTIVLTQKVAGVGEIPTLVVTQTGGGTLAVTLTVDTIDAVTGSNAVGLILHDTDVTAGNVNAQCLVQGIVNKDKVVSGAALAAGDIAALQGKITFIGG